MKKIYLLIAAIFLLSGCSNYTEEQPNNTETSYFEKNQDCFAYADDLYERYDYYEEENQSGSSIESVFYSPKVDSCVYIYVTYIGLNVHSKLVDVFTNETIIEADGPVSDFKEKVKELGYVSE